MFEVNSERRMEDQSKGQREERAIGEGRGVFKRAPSLDTGTRRREDAGGKARPRGTGSGMGVREYGGMGERAHVSKYLRVYVSR